MAEQTYPAKEKLRNFISVVAGVLLFFILLFALFPVFEKVNGLWQSNGTGAPTVEAAYGSMALALLLLLSIGMAAGFTAFIISTRKAFAHAVITGLILVALYFLAIGKDVPWRQVLQSTTDAAVNLSVPLLLLLGPCIGGLAGRLTRRKKG